MKGLRVILLSLGPVLMALALALTPAAPAQAGEGGTVEYVYKPKQFTAEEMLLMYVAQNGGYDTLIQDLVDRQMTLIRPKCEKPDRVVRQLPEPYYAIAFPADMKREGAPDHPISGQWKEVLKIQACGKVITMNFLVAAASMGMPMSLPLLNGDSLIDPIYQNNAEEKIATALNLKHPEHCEQGGEMLVQDTRVLGYIQSDRTLGKNDDDRGWFEEWDVWNCREFVKARVAMIVTDLGTFDIRVQLVE